MAEEPFGSAVKAVLVHKEAWNDKADSKKRWCMGIFAYTHTDGYIYGEKVLRSDAEAMQLERMEQGDCADLTFEQVGRGAKTYTRVSGVVPTRDEAFLDVKPAKAK